LPLLLLLAMPAWLLLPPFCSTPAEAVIATASKSCDFARLMRFAKSV
jgi:hypothetical protein